MQARMKNPVMLVPQALQGLLAVVEAVQKSAVPARTLELVHLRTSQINGCSFCIDMGAKKMRKEGETEERLFTVAAWRDAPWFSAAERAALALAEAVTRLADREDPVPDAIWNEATRYYDEPAMAGLLLMIAVTNVWNRLNVPTRQPAGQFPGEPPKARQ